MGGRAVSEEADVAQPRGRHQLFEIFPLTVFLAEGKDGRAHREQLFLTLVLPGHVPLRRQVVVGAGCHGGPGGPDPESVPQRWAVSLHVLCLQEGSGIHREQGPNPLRDLSMEDSRLVGQSLPGGPWRRR